MMKPIVFCLQSYGRHRRHHSHRTTQSQRKKHMVADGTIVRKQRRGVNQTKKPLLRLRIPPHDRQLVLQDKPNLERSPQTPIRLIATLQVSENQDEERSSKRSSRAARSLRFGVEKTNGLHRPPSERTNGVLQERLERHIQKLKLSMGLPSESDRHGKLTDRNQIQVPNGCGLRNDETKDIAYEGKRKRTASGLPESKRARIMQLDDEETRTGMSVKQVEKQTSDTGAETFNGARKPKDVTNVKKHRAAERESDTQRTRLASQGVLRERKPSDTAQRNGEEKGAKMHRLKLSDVPVARRKRASSNEKHQEVLKVSDTNRQKIPSKMSGDKLPRASSGMSDDGILRTNSGPMNATRKGTLSEILSEVGGEENSCVQPVSPGGDAPKGKLRQTAKSDALLTPKSTNRWLFDIRLSSSPVTRVEGQSSNTGTNTSATSNSVSQSDVKSENITNENSSSSYNGSSTKSVLNERIEFDPRSNGRRIQLVTHPVGKRIHIKSHPSHAGRGFATPRRKCVNRIESDESCGEETPGGNEGSQRLDERVNEMEEDAENRRNVCMEPKVEKEVS